MKVDPQTYAKVLTESIDHITDNFWLMVKKNQQEGDIPKIIEALEEEYAKRNSTLIARVYTEEKLTADEKTKITEKLEDKYDKKIVIKNILKDGVVGLIIKVNDQTIDLSLGGRIDALKKTLVN